MYSVLISASPTSPLRLQPELKKYMEKRISVKLNAQRTVVGKLRGYDHFMNLVLDDAQEEGKETGGTPIGLVLIRGNSILQIEALERLGATTASAASAVAGAAAAVQQA